MKKIIDGRCSLHLHYSNEHNVQLVQEIEEV